MRALELQALQKFEKAQANKKKTQTFKKKNRNSGRCKNSRRHGLKQKWIINDTKFNNNNIKTKKTKKNPNIAARVGGGTGQNRYCVCSPGQGLGYKGLGHKGLGCKDLGHKGLGWVYA